MIATQEAARSVPFGFFGVHTDRYTANSPAVIEREFALMKECGVETVRTTISWQHAQFWYSPDFEDPAAQDVLTDFSKSDRVVAAAARFGMQVLPMIWGTPWWSATSRFPGEKTEPLTIVGGVPRDAKDFGAFLKALVRRYGPDGFFWKANPDLPYQPIKWWQPWNEPDRPAFMEQPFDAKRFASILRAGYEGIKEVDPTATVVLSGLGPVCADSEDLFEKVYSGGVKGCFDVAALHPFPSTAEEVIAAVRLNRRVMERHGDGDLPLILSQLTWTSSKGQSRLPDLPSSTTEAGQAEQLRAIFNLAAKHRSELNLVGALWHGWCSVDREPQLPNSPDSFLWSGLRRVEPNGRFVSKPAFQAFRETLLQHSGRADELRGHSAVA